MGVYIPGMEMPKRGHTVTLTIMGGGEAVVQYYDCKPQLTVPIVYKAIPVPEHGRLGDLDELSERVERSRLKNKHINPLTKSCHDHEHDHFQLMILTAPAIVPADHIGDVNEMVTDKEGEG